MLTAINHIAIAVPNIEHAIAHYKTRLGAEVSDIQTLPEHGVRVAFVKLNGAKTEFLEPLDEHSPITKFLQKNPKGGLHHICYDVANFDDAIKNAEHAGASMLAPPKIGAHGERVVFIHPSDLCGVLTELQEVKKTEAEQ